MFETYNAPPHPIQNIRHLILTSITHDWINHFYAGDVVLSCYSDHLILLLIWFEIFLSLLNSLLMTLAITFLKCMWFWNFKIIDNQFRYISLQNLLNLLNFKYKSTLPLKTKILKTETAQNRTEAFSSIKFDISAFLVKIDAFDIKASHLCICGCSTTD